MPRLIYSSPLINFRRQITGGVTGYIGLSIIPSNSNKLLKINDLSLTSTFPAQQQGDRRTPTLAICNDAIRNSSEGNILQLGNAINTTQAIQTNNKLPSLDIGEFKRGEYLDTNDINEMTVLNDGDFSNIFRGGTMRQQRETKNLIVKDFVFDPRADDGSELFLFLYLIPQDENGTRSYLASVFMDYEEITK